MALKITHTTKPKQGIPLVLFMFESDVAAKHPLKKFLKKKEVDYITGLPKAALAVKEKEIKTFVLPDSGRKIFIVGLGKANEFKPWKAVITTRIAVQTARKEKLREFGFWAEKWTDQKSTRNLFELIASNAVMANFEFVKYKTPPPEGFIFLNEVQAIGETLDKNIAEGLRRGIIIGEETNACRELSNTPGGDMTPGILATHAVSVARKAGVKSTILDEKKIKSLGMGGVMGVAQGSDSPAKFIVLEYMKGPKGEKPIVLAGKGVTFDTGGLNLKPSEHIYEMHMDMSGGAAVIHAIVAAARLKVKKNIVALVPAVENMPSGSSYRPGDLLRTMSGKTIEVLNTDAEGRVILADALEYAKKYNPSLVVDVATLTGAAIAALGLRFTALFTTNKNLEEKFRTLSEATTDPVWPLPLSADWEDDIRGTFGDWANVGKSGQGGAIAGAVFLWQFTKDKKGDQAYPWVHLDIAPRMTTIDGEFLAKGAAGAPVRLLTRLLEE